MLDFLNGLDTENKSSLVAAINEIYGKELIANAIGADLLSNDTFRTMADKIDAMLLKLKTAIEQYGSDPLVTDAKLNAMIDSAIEIFETIGKLSDLETDNKSSIVDAINELLDDFEKIIVEREQDRQKLLEILRESGMELTGKESMDTLLDLLELNGIKNDDIKQIICSGLSMFILKNDDTLWACGANNGYQFGISDRYTRAVFTQINENVKHISISPSYEATRVHTFIIKNDGTVWAVGYNNHGQLGTGDGGYGYDRTTFTQITTNINNDVKDIICGSNHTFIIKNDSTVWATGLNNGQLGLGDTNSRNTFTQVTTNIDNVKEIHCGSAATFILKNDGTLWGCGNNNYGELGTGASESVTTFKQITDNVKQVSCGSATGHTAIIKNDGTLWVTGYNNCGQLGTGDNSTKGRFTQVMTNVEQVVCGYQHTVVLKNDGTLWGAGQGHALGLGHNGSSGANLYSFTQITVNVNNDIKKVYCGGDTTFILKNDGTIWSCGGNGYYQTGTGIDPTYVSAVPYFTKIPRL